MNFVNANRNRENAERLELMTVAFSGNKKAIKALMERLTKE